MIFQSNVAFQISYVKWSPANAMGEQKPMLATLNVSHRVRIFCHRLAWEPVCDITKLLYDHLVCEHWNLECKINYETTRGNEEMVKLVSLSFLYYFQWCSHFFHTHLVEQNF